VKPDGEKAVGETVILAPIKKQRLLDSLPNLKHYAYEKGESFRLPSNL